MCLLGGVYNKVQNNKITRPHSCFSKIMCLLGGVYNKMQNNKTTRPYSCFSYICMYTYILHFVVNTA